MMLGLRLRKLFFVVWFSLFVLSLILVIFAYETQGWRLTENGIITELSICRGPDPLTGRPIGITTTIIDLEKPIFACGYLRTSDKAQLSFYLFKEKTPKPIFTNEPVEIFSEGYFFWELNFGKKPVPAIYTVEIYLARKKLASTSFQIRKP